MCAATMTTRAPPTVAAIAVPCGAGALDGRCADGPGAFRRYWDRNAGSARTQLIWQAAAERCSRDDAAPIDAVARTSAWLAATTRQLTQASQRFLVVGGDHSCAIGTWNGAAEGLRGAALGLIWIDAHMDMHVPETTHSGAINGMPVAALLGQAPPRLVGGDRAAVAPDHICLVGARSFEPEELAFARRHNVRVIAMDEVSRRGIAAACAEARAIAGDGVAGYGVSLDLDAFDPKDAPGVGTPEPGGIRAGDFRDAWTEMSCSPLCVGVEIVEYNPYRDRGARTARLIGDLVAAMVRAERLRWVG